MIPYKRKTVGSYTENGESNPYSPPEASLAVKNALVVGMCFLIVFSIYVVYTLTKDSSEDIFLTADSREEMIVLVHEHQQRNSHSRWLMLFGTLVLLLVFGFAIVHYYKDVAIHIQKHQTKDEILLENEYRLKEELKETKERLENDCGELNKELERYKTDDSTSKQKIESLQQRVYEIMQEKEKIQRALYRKEKVLEEKERMLKEKEQSSFFKKLFGRKN